MVDLTDDGIDIDLAVRIGEPGDSTDLVARRLGVQQMVICGSPAYVAARGAPRQAADLADHDCIAGQHSPRRIAWLLKQPDGAVVPHTVPIKHTVCDFEMMLATIKAGHGLVSSRYGWSTMTSEAAVLSPCSTGCRAARYPSTCCGPAHPRCRRKFALLSMPCSTARVNFR